MKMVFAALCVLSFCACAIPAYCHPPQNISIIIEGPDVYVTVSHFVPNPREHFIKTIKVSINGATIIQQTFFLQEDSKQDVHYRIPGLKAGDTVAVEAGCFRFGVLVNSKKAE